MLTQKQEKLNRNGNRRGMSPESQKNLANGSKAAAKAQKVKDYSITRMIKEMLDDPVPERWLEVEDKEKGFTFRQAIAKRILIESARGNAKVTSELLDRLEGKVIQPIGGDKENPVFLSVLSRLRGHGNEDA